MALMKKKWTVLTFMLFSVENSSYFVFLILFYEYTNEHEYDCG
jgi:hypothetical protein